MQKTVFISGGNRGIGQSILKKFYENSWETHSCSRSEDLKNEFAHYTYICDVSNPKEVKELFEKIANNSSKLDCVVNNAGVAGANDLNSDAGIEQWDNVISTNLSGPFYISKFSQPLLQSGANIINIASVLAHTGVPDQSAYCAAKHGLLGLTKSLAKALAFRGIKVNSISPGWVNTDMAANRSTELGIPLSQLAEQIPLGEIINPEEIANAVYFLAENNLKNFTGQSLVIDGGFLS